MDEAVSPYDDPAVSAGEIADYLYCPKPQQSTNNMSYAQEQAQRERIAELLTELGMPEPGKLHVVNEIDATAEVNVEIDELYEPLSAVIRRTDRSGNEQCFDKDGYQVYAD